MNTGNEPPVPDGPTPPPGRVKDARGRFITTLAHDERAAQAARLKADNPRMTLQQIADAVGYTHKADAWRAIDKCRKGVVQQAGAELVASEAAQLDDLYVAALEVLERDHVTVSHGRIVTGEDGQPLLDDGPKLAAIRELRAIRESYRKLHGLDAEKKISLSGGVRYEVVGIDPADLT
ncbi:hypothetical protein J7I98_23620 [Streptomyces sp. ISL-98]|uniref:hypothetical protein n=1 Tax=Streptomyces sp. ISL-98 TaxID=2819192 RepID=UPI001BE90611|nr:hypothetical protein [Streptomyces sp. ISL-98]MBT2508820.1 hypothetical protein [Streptomyces sp. ISL-98]